MSAAPQASVVLRPRRVFESADLALRFIALRARAYGVLGAIVILPAFLGTLALREVARLDWPLVWAVSLVLAPLCEGPFTVLSGELGLGNAPRVTAVLRAFAGRAFAFIVVSLASVIVRTLALVLFIVPYALVASATVFLPEVVLLERAGARSILRSMRVVQGQGGRAIGVLWALILTRVGATVLADIALRATLGAVFEVHLRIDSFATDLGSPYALFGLWLSVPFCAAIRYFAYIDTRTVREAWDLQRRLALWAARLREEG